MKVFEAGTLREKIDENPVAACPNRAAALCHHFLYISLSRPLPARRRGQWPESCLYTSNCECICRTILSVQRMWVQRLFAGVRFQRD